MVNNGIGKTLNCLMVTLRKVLVLIMWFTFPIINKYYPKDNLCTISGLELSTVTDKFTHIITCADVVL